VAVKDPTAWMEDLSVYLDDDDIVETAAAMEPTLLYGGSKAAAAAWIALLGVLGGAFGGVTLSPGIRQPVTFVCYLVVAALLLRGLHPLTVRLLGRAVAWLGMMAFFWAVLLGSFAVLGARMDSRLFAYGISVGCGAFIGLMYGSLTPGVTRREDLWMMASLPLAPLSAALATFLLRRTTGSADTLNGTMLAGALAGVVFMGPMSALLGRVWDEAHGLTSMGLLYLHNANFAQRAVAYFDRAIAIEPGNPQYYNLRGVAWSQMGEPQRAAEDWDRASALAPVDPEPDINRGIDFLQRGEVADAIRSLEAALLKNPAVVRTHRILGKAYERQGNLDRAIDHYDRALALAPDDAKAHSDRSHAYLRKGDFDRALQDCERAIRLEPALGIAYAHYGHVLAALGRSAEAANSYREALELDPEPSVREEALRGLQGLDEEAALDEPA
jgi:Flp pilus assembly protein TadD